MTSKRPGAALRRSASFLIASGAAVAAIVALNPTGAVAGTVAAKRPTAGEQLILTARLRPSGRREAHAASGPVIDCVAYFGQLPHFSKKYKDISWHYTWTCDDPSASAFGQSTLYYDNLPVENQHGRQSGVKGDFNVRYGCSTGTVWSHGVATITFSAPYHTSATAEGGSPTKKITC
jgi:hypothetical protein